MLQRASDSLRRCNPICLQALSPHHPDCELVSRQQFLLKIAHAVWDEHSPLARAWLEVVQGHLYEGRLGSVIRACRALVSQAPQSVVAARAYFTANRTRLHYPTFRALSLQIGSGSCKQITLERLKIAGARKLAKARAPFSVMVTTQPYLQRCIYCPCETIKQLTVCDI